MKRIDRKCVDCGRSSGLFNLCILCRAKVPGSKTAKPKVVDAPKTTPVIRKWKGIQYNEIDGEFHCGFKGCKYHKPNETAVKTHITKEHL